MDNDTVWVGMLDVRPGPDGTGGAYAFCAARAAGAAAAVAAVSGDGFDIAAIEWLAPYASLPQPRRESEAVAEVVNALGDGEGVLARFFSYPAEDEPDLAGALKERGAGVVEGGVDRGGREGRGGGGGA